MEILKGYKYRLRLKPHQAKRIDEWINTSRAIYNVALETKMYAWKSRQVKLTAYDLMKQMTECRREFDWVWDVPTGTLEDAIKRMDVAYKNFFRGQGYPKWARKDRFNSIGMKYTSQTSDNTFKLPKIGEVKVFEHRVVTGQIRKSTISRKNGKYYISVLVKETITVPTRKDNSQVGIDVGISYLASLSDGRQIDNPRILDSYYRKLRIEQRSLSRKAKFSNSWKKQKLKVGKIQEKIANTRIDYLHKTTRALVNDFTFISVEDLNVTSMKLNKNLSRFISDVAWGEFFRQLEYKASWYGSEFVKVTPNYSSQTCASCGSINSKSRKSQSFFKCVDCGYESNADVNAALEILKRGQDMAISR